VSIHFLERTFSSKYVGQIFRGPVFFFYNSELSVGTFYCF